MKKKAFALIILIAVLILLFGKVLFSYNGDIVLYVYGVSVTLVLVMNYFVAFFVYKDPYKVALNNNPPNKNYLVTCMVAVYNEEEIIEQCIKSVINQTYQNKEVIFVNDCSTDGTAAILDQYAAKGLIKAIHMEKNVMKKRALGMAMLEAKGEIFAFTDSDSVWEPEAIERIVKIFEDRPDVGAVSGHSRALNATSSFMTKVQDPWYENQYSVRKAFESVFGDVTCVSGPLAVFRREAVFNLVPAWENDSFLGQEFKFATDRTMTGFVLGSKWIAEGLKKKYADSPFVKNENHEPRDWKIVYCKSARSYTQVPDTFRKAIKQQVRWKKSFIRNMFFTGKFYWRKHLLTAFVYYLHLLFVLVGPFIAFRRLILMPITGSFASAILYIMGILLIGFTFSLAYMVEDDSNNRWLYRPLMGLFSTLVFSWLIFYSALTIRNMKWRS